MKRFATLAFGLTLLASSSGCCCLGPMFGMGGGGGGCQPCGGGAYGAGYQSSSPCGPGGCGGAYAPNGNVPTAYYPGAVQQAGVPYSYQTTALNMNPVW